MLDGNKKPWFVYLVQCSDNTLYCGITNDLDERINEHNNGQGAKYTMGRRPVKLRWVSLPIITRGKATIVESKIKKLSREEKWHLIKGD